MSDVWFRGPYRLDMLTAAVLTSSASWDRPDLAQQAMGAVEPGSVTTYSPGSPWTQRVYVIVSPSFVVVVIPGTETWQQFIGDVLGSVQASQPPIPGQVALYWGQLGQRVWGEIGAQVAAALPGRRLVLMGHSLGGAVAQVVAALAARQLGTDLRVFVLGCPRVGNPAFASSFGPSQVWRVATTYDPVAEVPPPLWGGLSLPLPWPGPPVAVIYQHAGNGYALDAAGTLSVQGAGLPLGSVAALLISGDASTRHSIDTYAGRLRAQLAPGNFIPGAVGYTDPRALDRVLLALQGLAGVGMGLPAAPPPPIFVQQDSERGNGSMSTWRLTYMFKSKEYGWSESYYVDGETFAIAKAEAEELGKVRLGLCGLGVSMDAVRISDTTLFRDYGLSPLGLSTGEEDTTSASHVKPYNSLLCNLVNGPYRNRVFLRGIPSGDYLGDDPLNLGAAWNKAFNAWKASLKKNNIKMRLQDRFNLAIQGTIVAADTMGPITVTLDKDSTMQDGDQIVIRGAQGQTSINGRHFVSRVTARTFVVRNTLSVAPYLGKGVWRAVQYIYQTINDVVPIREVSRRTGRPFDTPVGRRRKARSS